MLQEFKVRKVAGPPQFDSLPVAKITDYPLEKRDYKPFAQCNLCITGQELVLRMWAFEVSPLPRSALRCVLYPFAKESAALETTISPAGKVTATADQKPLKTAVHPFGGEDLQGVYWGATVTVTLADLEAAGGPLALEPTFPGNFYKLCDAEPFVHSGSCFPADFAGGNPYGRESMGVLRVVSY